MIVAFIDSLYARSRGSTFRFDNSEFKETPMGRTNRSGLKEFHRFARTRSVVCRVTKCVLLLCLYCSGASAHNGVIHTHHDDIPDFGVNPTLVSVRSGNWSDPGTFGGRVPGQGDVVQIAAGTAVRYDALSDAAVETVSVEQGGVLAFAEDTSTRLRLANLLVKEGGVLTIGTPASPIQPQFTAEVVFLNRAINTATDPFQWSIGLISLGQLTAHGRDPGKSYIRLAAEVAAGASELVLSEPATGWRVGDVVALPDSTQHWRIHGTPHKYSEKIEEFAITAISPDGLRISLNRSASHAHPGVRDRDGVVRFLPHAIHTTRNVIFRSEDPNGVRGHTSFTHHGVSDVRYVSFLGLGRTLNIKLDSTTKDASGNITHVGTNQVGRYAVHYHHVLSTGSSFVGNYVDGYVDDPLGQRAGVWIHSSYGITVSNNVVRNAAAWAIGTEKGNERWLSILNNFALNIVGNYQRPDGLFEQGEPGAIGAAYWFRGGLDITFAGNIAANVTEGFNLFFTCCPLTTVPKAPGLDPHDPSQAESYNPQAVDFSVQGFEVYASRTSFEWWNVSQSCKGDGSIAQTRVQDAAVWHTSNLALNYPGSNVQVERLQVFNDLSIFDTTGMTLGDYQHPNFLLADSEFQGVGGTAFTPTAHSSGGVQKIVRSKFINNGGAIYIPSPFHSGPPDWLPPHRMVLQDVTVESPRTYPLGVPQGAQIVLGGFQENAQNMRLAQARFENVSIDGRSTNGSVYRLAQHPKFVVPPSIVSGAAQYSAVGSPTIGLTNEQLQSGFGMSVGGEVSPCTSVSRKLAALVCDAPPEAQQLAVISWGLKSKLNGSGGFDLFAAAVTNEPAVLTVEINGQTFSSPGPAFNHLLPIGSFPPSVEKFGRAAFASGSLTAEVPADRVVVRTGPLDDPAPPDAYENYFPTLSHSPTGALFTIRSWSPVLLRVEYGTSTALGTIGYQSEFFEAGGYSSGTAELKNLSPDTAYFAQVILRSAAGVETRLPIQSFRTPPSSSSGASVYADVDLSTDRNRCVSGPLNGSRQSGSSYRLLSVPQNGAAGFDAEGNVTYTPFPGSTGLDSFQYVVSDPQGRTSQPATVSVNVRGGTTNAPEIDAVPSLDGVQGQRLTYQVGARSPAGRTLTYSTFGALAAAIGPTNGLIDFVVSANQAAGSYVVGVEVRDSSGERSSRSFVIQVRSGSGGPGGGGPGGPGGGGPGGGAPGGDGNIAIAAYTPVINVALRGRSKLTVPLKVLLVYNGTTFKELKVKRFYGVWGTAPSAAPTKLSSRTFKLSPTSRKKGNPLIAKVLSSKLTVRAPGRYTVAVLVQAGTYTVQSMIEVNVS